MKIMDTLVRRISSKWVEYMLCLVSFDCLRKQHPRRLADCISTNQKLPRINSYPDIFLVASISESWPVSPRPVKNGIMIYLPDFA